LSIFPNFVLWHFINYNLCDWIGKTISIVPWFTIQNTRTVFYLTLARSFFIPAVLLCNIVLYNHESKPYPPHFSVVFSDAWYMVIMAFFAFSNGWLTTSCFIQAPQVSKAKIGDDNKTMSITADLMVLGLALGLASGGMLTFLFTAISCQCNPF
jgi:solute carrier family 29 (equilibrative nucleoside transporter), member 1/2/3